MQRNPAIHITVQNLKLVLSRIGLPEEKAWEILEASKPFSIKTRSVSKNGKAVDKLQRTLSTNEDLVDIFHGILTTMRMEANHRGITTINKTDKNYTLLKEIAANAKKFIDDFNISPVQEGFRQYCYLGLKMMGKKYGLNKFKYYNEKINQTYEFSLVIDSDENPEGSNALYNAYIACMQKYAGIAFESKKDVERYVNFVYARKEADENKANYMDWVTAQFEELAWLNAIPDPPQLLGDNALLRYQKYVVKKKQGATQAEEELEEFNSPDEAEYFRLLRGGK